MIQITPHIALRDDEIQMDFIRSSGAGGQNVNKVSTAVQLRFDARNSPSLSDEIKERLLKLGAQYATNDGTLIFKAQSFRTQDKNRQDAIERLVALIQQAIPRPVVRRPTKPTRGSKERRLTAKRIDGARKQSRRISDED